MTLVFMLEEASMKELLDGLMPRFFPGVEYKAITHNGKSDLEKSIPRKLRAWKEPGVRFIGDLQAVETALVRSNLARRQMERKFRAPDSLGSPSSELKSLIPDYQKVSGARTIGQHLREQGNRSRSFAVFIAGIRKLLS